MALRRPSGKPSKSSKGGGPLDERQRKLLDEEARVLKEMDHLSRVIEEAPRIKAERVRAQRDELLTDRSARAHRLNATTLADTRYELPGAAAPSRARRRTLKAERRQTRLIFFGLLLILSVLVLWLLSVWHWQIPG